MIWWPEREIEIVAGTPPGGGLDRSARSLVAAIAADKLVDVPVRVVNVCGDGGRKAWSQIERYAGDGHVIGISSPNMAADYLTGVTKFDPERFVPLAILYSEYIAFVVHADSTIRHFWTGMYLDGAALRDYLARERSDMRAMLGELGLLASGG